jgi:hypothetical protein
VIGHVRYSGENKSTSTKGCANHMLTHYSTQHWNTNDISEENQIWPVHNNQWNGWC